MEILTNDNSGDIDLRRFWLTIFRRYWIIVGFALTATLGAMLINYSTRPVYSAQSLVLIEREGQNTLSQEGVKVDTRLDDYYQTQYEIIKSRSMSELVVKDLGLDKHPDYAGDAVMIVQNAVSVIPIKRTRVFNLRAEAFEPKLAADIANTLSQRFIEQSVESKMFLSKEVLKVLNPALGASFESLPAVVNNPLIQQLKVELAKLQMQRAELSKNYQPKHPSMLQLQAQIQETQAQIDREVSHIAESVKIQLSGQLQGKTVRIIDPAQVPTSPSKPQKLRNILVAFFIGLILGLFTAVIIDQFDLTIRNQEEFESLAKLPCLAMMNQILGMDPEKLGRYDVVWKDGRSHSAENFRNLRTALSFRLSNLRGSKTLLVTSAVQGEGKSFISVNMARVFAQNGDRVLLIDGDMRRPSVHRIFNLPNEKGLSSYLTGSEEPVRLLADSGIQNLKLLPCGPIPDSPAELLTDQKLKPLLAWATGEFDLVIVDSPPVFPVTDALLWGKQVHGIVFVVQAGKARLALVLRALRNLKDGFSNVFGGVLNQMSLKGGDAYAYYYRYYGKYGGDKEKTKGHPKDQPTAV